MLKDRAVQQFQICCLKLLAGREFQNWIKFHMEDEVLESPAITNAIPNSTFHSKKWQGNKNRVIIVNFISFSHHMNRWQCGLLRAEHDSFRFKLQSIKRERRPKIYQDALSQASRISVQSLQQLHSCHCKFKSNI